MPSRQVLRLILVLDWQKKNKKKTYKHTTKHQHKHKNTQTHKQTNKQTKQQKNKQQEPNNKNIKTFVLTHFFLVKLKLLTQIFCCSNLRCKKSFTKIVCHYCYYIYYYHYYYYCRFWCSGRSALDLLADHPLIC